MKLIDNQVLKEINCYIEDLKQQGLDLTCVCYKVIENNPENHEDSLNMFRFKNETSGDYIESELTFLCILSFKSESLKHSIYIDELRKKEVNITLVSPEKKSYIENIAKSLKLVAESDKDNTKIQIGEVHEKHSADGKEINRNVLGGLMCKECLKQVCSCSMIKHDDINKLSSAELEEMHKTISGIKCLFNAKIEELQPFFSHLRKSDIGYTIIVI